MREIAVLIVLAANCAIGGPQNWAEECATGGPNVIVESQTVDANTSKAGFVQFYPNQVYPTVSKYYLQRVFTSEILHDYEYDCIGEANDSPNVPNWNYAGPIEGTLEASDTATETREMDWDGNYITIEHEGIKTSLSHDEDHREWRHGCSKNGITSCYYVTNRVTDVSHNLTLSTVAGIASWSGTYEENEVVSVSSANGLDATYPTNGVYTIESSVPDFYSKTNMFEPSSRTTETIVSESKATYSYNYEYGGCWSGEETEDTTIELSKEFTRQMLVSKVKSKIPPFGGEEDWEAGSGVAELSLSEDEYYAYGSRMKYRFYLVDLEKYDEEGQPKRYTLTWSEIYTYPDGRVRLSNRSKIIAPTSSTMRTTPIFVDVPAVEVQITVGNVQLSDETGCLIGCGDVGHASAGSGAARNSSVDFTIDLGLTSLGASAGHLSVYAAEPSDVLASTLFLRAFTDSSVEVITQAVSNTVRQVKAPQALADVVTIDPFKYEVRLYYTSQVGALGGDGLYSVTGTPYMVYAFENPNASALDVDDFRVTQTEGSESYVWNYSYDSNTDGWTLVYPGALKEETVSYWDDLNNGLTMVTRTVKGPEGATVSQSVQTYQQYTWGLGLVEETLGTGAAARTTSYDYYNVAWIGGGLRPLLKQAIHPDGTWEYFQYLEAAGDGRLFRVYRPYRSMPFSATPDFYATRVTEYSYSGYDPLDDGTVDPHIPRLEIDTIEGVEVGRRYRVLVPGERRDIVCVNSFAAWDAAENLVTIRKYFTSGSFEGMIKSIEHPDGTMQIYSYADNVDGSRTTTIYSGEPNGGGTAIVSGTKTEVKIGAFGEVESKIVTDVASNIVMASETHSNFDGFRRAQKVTYLDGTFEETFYSCCGLDNKVDRDGVAVQYWYDAMKRPVAQTLVNFGITITNILDAADNVLVTKRIGSDNSEIVQRKALYDLAGRLTRETNALNGVTQYAESTNTAWEFTRTVTQPDGGTRVETYHTDGSLKMVSGTVAQPLNYFYGVEDDGNWGGLLYTVEVKVGATSTDTNEWTRTKSDFAGRHHTTFYADSTPSDQGNNPYERSYYNTQGQLTARRDADDVWTLFQYNGEGDVEYTAIDANPGNTTVDSNGNYPISFTADRITRTEKDVINHGTYGNVRRQRNYAWDSAGVDSATLVSKVETAVNGLATWSTLMTNSSAGVVTQRATVYGTGGLREEISMAPDGSYVVQQYQHGRLAAVTRRDSTDAQLGQTVHGYDAHGRQASATDARSGTSWYGYNAMDQVTTVTTPPPGTGEPAQTTVTAYNSMGQAWQVTHPDQSTTTREYYLTGLLKKTYGSRTYPVEYTYDTQGRMKTMTTWLDFASTAGAAITTWNYDQYRGWLENKRYDDNRGPDYTYTTGGKLKTRVWARGSSRVTTTYNYNALSDLWTVVYSNDPASTPTVTYTYDRRGRQETLAQTGRTSITVNYGLGGVLQGESYSGGPLEGLTVESDFDTYLRRTGVGVNDGSAMIATNTYSYDNASRLEVIGDDAGHTATYGYLANSSLVEQVEFKEGSTTRMTTSKRYDRLNRLQSISSVTASHTWSYGYQYNQANQRTRTTLADGSFWVYKYDTLGQVISGKRYWKDGTPVAGQQFEYGFDTIGNRLATKAGGDQAGGNLRSATYTPNSLNQYSSRTVPGAVDVLGIATATASVTVNSTPAAYRRGEYFWSEVGVNNSSAAYPAISVTATSGGSSTTESGNIFVPPAAESFVHDYDGNLTQDGRWTYTWDAENRLIKMESLSSGPSGSKRLLEFEYDARGRRIRKKVTNVDTATVISEVKMIYDGWNLLAELNVSGGTLERSYVWGLDLSGSMQGAGGVGGLLFVKNATATHAASYDGNGNVVGIGDMASGAMSASYEYGPFGEVIRESGSAADENPIRFSTKYQDGESELLYYGFRYYKSSTGRWLSRDPIEEDGGLNLNAFVGNDLLATIDRFGLEVYELAMMTFIEQAVIPAPGILTGYFLGDANNGSFRTVHRILVETCGPTRGLIADSEYKDTGITIWMNDDGTERKRGKAPTSGLVARVYRFGDGVEATLYGSARNPLTPLFAPNITYKLTVRFNTRTGKANWSIFHDAFPAYSAAAGAALYNYSAIAAGADPWDLIGRGNAVSKSGTFDIAKCCD